MDNLAEILSLARQQQLSGNLTQAEGLYHQILKANPSLVDAWNYLGSTYQSLGRLDDSALCLERALQLKPDHVEALNNRGITFYMQGKPNEAAAFFQRTIQVQPNHVFAYNNLGAVLRDLGRAEDSAACCRKAIELKPDYPEAHNNLGNALHALGKSTEAIASIREALRLRPNYPQAFNNLGLVLATLNRNDEAAASYREAIRLQPAFHLAFNNLGVLQAKLGQILEAEKSYREALRLRPDFADAYFNLGLMMGRERLEEAIQTFQQALQLRPNHADTYNQMAMVYMVQGRLEEALGGYRQAVHLKPDDARLRSNLLLCLNYDSRLSNEALLAEHTQWEAVHGRTPRLGPAPQLRYEPERILRVGYLSPDFRKHAVSYFFEPILKNHNRAQVETTCYAQVANPDEVTKRFQSYTQRWRFINDLSDAQVAELIQRDGIDILVDLAGHAGSARLKVMSYRPAPIQISYLGYSNTTGLSAVDYRLTDEVANPPWETAHYSEELVRLPGCFCCYQPPSNAPAVSPLPAASAGFVTFGSVQNLAKINDGVIDLWCEVLKAVPSSRLLMYRDVLLGRTSEVMARRFTDRGIASERLILESGSGDGTDYLPIYQRIDLLLDTFPFCGHTTVCEALWMGVPTLTLRGDRYASRTAASVLTTLNLGDLIADDREEFVNRAVAWAGAFDRLKALRASLRERMLASPLCDGKRFTQQLEQVYRDLWRRKCTSMRAAVGEY